MSLTNFTRKLRKLPYIIKHIRSGKAGEELAVEDVIRSYVAPKGIQDFSPPKVLYCVTKYDYGNPMRGFAVEEITFYHTLSQMPVDLYRFDPVEIERKYGTKVVQNALLNTVSWLSPDVVFFVVPSLYNMETINEISQNTHSQTVNWACDDHWAFDKIMVPWLPKLNWAVTTDPDAVQKYKSFDFENVMLTTWACNHFLFKPLKIKKRYDVTFIGQVYGIRSDIINRLRSDGVELSVFGYGTKGGRLSFREMIKTINESKICINFSGSSEGNTLQTKARVFEVMGCGTLCLCEYLPDIESHYKIDDEVVCWKSYDELKDKINFYLQNDEQRERIAIAGFSRTIREHTYVHRFCDIFERVLDNKGLKLREMCKHLGLLPN